MAGRWSSDRDRRILLSPITAVWVCACETEGGSLCATASA